MEKATNIMNTRLPRSFFLKDSYQLAQDLIGKVLCLKQDKEIKKYRIVETEAYGGITDKAAHSYQNTRTPRTESMYLEGGHLYVYFIYGMYHMLNIVANVVDNPEAVLIRAVEPLENVEGNMETNGPGKLCKTLGIDKRFDRLDLCTSDEICLLDETKTFDIVISKRINIDYAEEDKERLWRFYIKDNPFVSKNKEKRGGETYDKRRTSNRRSI